MRCCLVLLLVMVGFSSLCLGQEFKKEPSFQLDQPGVLVITAAQDTAAGFAWQPGPGPGRISLVWEGGVLSIPDTLAMEGYPNLNLGIPVKAGFFGRGKEGPLAMEDGIYQVSEDLMMSDGVVQLMVSDGELEINGPRIRYTQPVANPDNPVSNYLFIAGLLILIAVLLRRARLKSRKGS
jgi:hypothetical protein